MKRILKISFTLLVTVALLVIIGNFTVLYLIDRGNNFFNKNNFKKAIDNYTLAYKISKEKDINSNLKRARKMQTSDKSYQSALANLKHLKYEAAYNLFIKVIPEDRHYKDAQERLPTLEELIQQQNDIARSIEQYKKGLSLYNEGNLQSALEYLTRVINDDPNYGQAQLLIADINSKLNTDQPRENDQEVVSVTPRTLVFTQPVRKPVIGYITIKPYGYDFGYNFNNYSGPVKVDIFIVNTDTAKTTFLLEYSLKPNDANLPTYIFDRSKNNGLEPKSDYRVKIYYNGKVVEVHNLSYYVRR